MKKICFNETTYQELKGKKLRNQRYYRACVHFQEINYLKIEHGELGMFKPDEGNAHLCIIHCGVRSVKRSRNQRILYLSPEKHQPRTTRLSFRVA